jgi:fucose permease
MEEEKPVTLTIRQLLKVKGLKPVWLMFFASCTVEYLCNAWGATFLVEHKDMGEAQAASTVTVYFVGLAAGRFLSGLFSGWLTPKKLVIMGQITLASGILLLFLPIAPWIGLLLVGLGIGPIYPNLMHLTPGFFGREVSQSVMGSQMAAASLAFVLTPFLFAPLAQGAGLWVFPVYLAAMGALLILGTATSKLKNIR